MTKAQRIEAMAVKKENGGEVKKEETKKEAKVAA